MKVRSLTSANCVSRKCDAVSARDLLLPFLKDTVVNVLEIAAETKVGGVANAMEELLEHFEDTVVPIVVEFIDEKVIVYSYPCI